MRMIRYLLTCIAVMHVVGLAQAETTGEEFSARYPKGAIDSVTIADRALAEATEARSRIEARYREEEHACHTKFFVTACMEEAKERRRNAISPIRPVELEAAAFKRKQRVVLRDQALETRQAQDKGQSVLPTINRNSGGHAEAQEAVRETAAAGSMQKAQENAQDRQALHAARLRQRQEEDSRNAAQRAKNIAAYQAKLRASEERQKRVAEKLAGKQRRVSTDAVMSTPGKSSD